MTDCHSTYTKFKHAVNNTAVVNDRAEKHIKLVQDFIDRSHSEAVLHYINQIRNKMAQQRQIPSPKDILINAEERMEDNILNEHGLSVPNLVRTLEEIEHVKPCEELLEAFF